MFSYTGGSGGIGTHAPKEIILVYSNFFEIPRPSLYFKKQEEPAQKFSIFKTTIDNEVQHTQTT
jgi:hypothetical protein